MTKSLRERIREIVGKYSQVVDLEAYEFGKYGEQNITRIEKLFDETIDQILQAVREELPEEPSIEFNSPKDKFEIYGNYRKVGRKVAIREMKEKLK